jgi:hypothetical protein
MNQTNVNENFKNNTSIPFNIDENFLSNGFYNMLNDKMIEYLINNFWFLFLFCAFNFIILTITTLLIILCNKNERSNKFKDKFSFKFHKIVYHMKNEIIFLCYTNNKMEKSTDNVKKIDQNYHYSQPTGIIIKMIDIIDFIKKNFRKEYVFANTTPICKNYKDFIHLNFSRHFDYMKQMNLINENDLILYKKKLNKLGLDNSLINDFIEIYTNKYTDIKKNKVHEIFGWQRLSSDKNLISKSFIHLLYFPFYICNLFVWLFKIITSNLVLFLKYFIWTLFTFTIISSIVYGLFLSYIYVSDRIK